MCERRAKGHQYVIQKTLFTRRRKKRCLWSKGVKARFLEGGLLKRSRGGLKRKQGRTQDKTGGGRSKLRDQGLKRSKYKMAMVLIKRVPIEEGIAGKVQCRNGERAQKGRSLLKGCSRKARSRKRW